MNKEKETLSYEDKSKMATSSLVYYPPLFGRWAFCAGFTIRTKLCKMEFRRDSYSGLRGQGSQGLSKAYTVLQ